MRIGLQSWGSEGDLRPMVALAAALQRSGHSVRLDLTPVDSTDYRALCAAMNVPLRIIPEEMTFSLQDVDAEAERLDPLRLSRRMVEKAFHPFIEELYQAALSLCAESDLVVWHYSCWYTKAAALKTGIPHASVNFFPGLAPTRSRPPGGLPNLGPLNAFLWLLAGFALDLQFRKRPRAFFQEKGLPLPRHVLPDLLFSEHLNLHASSPLLLPRPSDWEPHHQVTGQLRLPELAEPWTPSAGLRAFLEAGPPPVLLSLGSMEHFAPKRARAFLIDGARASGVRALIQSKRGHREEGREGDLYFLPWAPHAALLPLCAAAVHHGGAGTSHDVLRAGLPSVVVPFMFEQQVWADRLAAAGVATRALSFWKAEPEQLADRLREVTQSEALIQRSRSLGNSCSSEDGSAAAVSLLTKAAANFRS